MALGQTTRSAWRQGLSIVGIKSYSSVRPELVEGPACGSTGSPRTDFGKALTWRGYAPCHPQNARAILLGMDYRPHTERRTSTLSAPETGPAALSSSLNPRPGTAANACLILSRWRLILSRWCLILPTSCLALSRKPKLNETRRDRTRHFPGVFAGQDRITAQDEYRPWTPLRISRSRNGFAARNALTLRGLIRVYMRSAAVLHSR